MYVITGQATFVAAVCVLCAGSQGLSVCYAVLLLLLWSFAYARVTLVLEFCDMGSLRDALCVEVLHMGTEMLQSIVFCAVVVVAVHVSAGRPRA